MKQRLITYNGATGRVTSDIIETDQEEEIVLDDEELDPSDPFFNVQTLSKAIINHVTRQVQSQQRTQ